MTNTIDRKSVRELDIIEFRVGTKRRVGVVTGVVLFDESVADPVYDSKTLFVHTIDSKTISTSYTLEAVADIKLLGKAPMLARRQLINLIEKYLDSAPDERLVNFLRQDPSYAVVREITDDTGTQVLGFVAVKREEGVKYTQLGIFKSQDITYEIFKGDDNKYRIRKQGDEKMEVLDTARLWTCFMGMVKQHEDEE